MSVDFDRRSFLKGFAALSGSVAVPGFVAKAAASVSDLAGGAVPQYDDWKDIFRQQWSWDKVVRSTPHLPYELMVNGNKVIALHPHYRLAVNFPDLKMFGKNSFGKLMDLPYVYEEFFTQAVGGKWPPESGW